MILCFKLSMPGVNSWNNQWSGQGKLYAIVKNMGSSKKAEEKAAKLVEARSFYYNFGDGWAASISVERVDPVEASRLRKRSQGFCGYDWMVGSILTYGEILSGKAMA